MSEGIGWTSTSARYVARCPDAAAPWGLLQRERCGRQRPGERLRAAAQIRSIGVSRRRAIAVGIPAPIVRSAGFSATAGCCSRGGAPGSVPAPRRHPDHRQRVQVELRYAGQIVTIEVDETTLRVYDQRDHVIKTVPCTSGKEVRRHKAYGHTTNRQIG